MSIDCAAALAWAVMESLCPEIRPGLSTWDIDQRIRVLIAEQGGEPALLGYLDFPAAACLSVNEVVANGLPSQAVILGERDLIGINIAVKKDGFHAAHNRTLVMPKAPTRFHALAEAAEAACLAGIAAMKPGATSGDVGAAIAAETRRHGFAVISGAAGHGIGRHHHQDPSLSNDGQPGEGETLREGMTLAPMPMIVMGKAATRTKADGWSIATRDGKAGAEWKHTVRITATGAEILTHAPNL